MLRNDPSLEEEVDRTVLEKLATEKREAAVKRKLELIRRYGTDNWPEGQVMKFVKHFGTTDVGYTYAAIKVNDMWYTTGPRGNSFTWDEFVAWLVSGPNPTMDIVALVPSGAKESAPENISLTPDEFAKESAKPILLEPGESEQTDRAFKSPPF